MLPAADVVGGRGRTAVCPYGPLHAVCPTLCQRQRLSLARTLLNDPPILILDEATAMFDPEGENSFIEECQELLNLRTVILITHRPASLALADRIVRIEAGSDITNAE